MPGGSLPKMQKQQNQMVGAFVEGTFELDIGWLAVDWRFRGGGGAESGNVDGSCVASICGCVYMRRHCHS